MSDFGNHGLALKSHMRTVPNILVLFVEKMNIIFLGAKLGQVMKIDLRCMFGCCSSTTDSCVSAFQSGCFKAGIAYASTAPGDVTVGGVDPAVQQQNVHPNASPNAPITIIPLCCTRKVGVGSDEAEYGDRHMAWAPHPVAASHSQWSRKWQCQVCLRELEEDTALAFTSGGRISIKHINKQVAKHRPHDNQTRPRTALWFSERQTAFACNMVPCNLS